MVHFGRAEIVTVTLLCNKPACRKTPESGVDHKLASRHSFFILLFFLLLIHCAVKLRFPISFGEITNIDGQRYQEKI